MVLVVMERVYACMCYVCLWMGRLQEKIIFLNIPSKTWLSGTVENKFLELPILECLYGLGLKSFRVLHPNFSVHIFLATQLTGGCY